MSQVVPTDAEKLRRYLFTPMETMEGLHAWIKVYLGLDLPDCMVDESSTSSPMHSIWEVYDKARKNDDPEFNRILTYAARDSFKTLGASILEVLMVLHLGRSVAHMAAIEGQAQKSQEYVKKFLSRPMLRDFVVGNNKRRVEVLRYYNEETGVSLSSKEFGNLTEAEKNLYTPITNYIAIVVCTMQGANCVDPATTITMADGSLRSAVEVEPGDLVKTYDLKSREWTTSVVGDKGIVRKPRMRVKLSDGGSIVVSEDHQVFTDSGWKFARALRLGDRLFTTGERSTSHESDEMWEDDHSYTSNPESVLLGTLLGDASLSWPKQNGKKYGQGPRVQMFHSSAQTDYLHWKLKKLEGLGLRWNTTSEMGGEHAFSCVSSSLVPLYELLYGSGRKRMTQEVLDRVDLEALAYWFMDDGRGNGRVVGARKDHRFQLATCCFSEEENRLIVEWLKKKFDLDARISSASNGKKRYPVVEFSLEASRKLSLQICRFVPASMRYKLVPPADALKTKCVDCGAVVEYAGTHKFARCSFCPAPNGRKDRERARVLKAMCRLRVESLEFLPSANMVDIHLEVDHEQKRNFVGNSSILLHNSEHVPFMTIDEVDVVTNPKAYEEAQAIPAPYEGKDPITLLTSTRKFSIGLVQKEIDNAHETGLQIRHWNIIDVTQRCPASRHRPDLPKVMLYHSEETLRTISEKQYKELDEEQQEIYQPLEGFQGCIDNCRIFAACKGRLADKQISTSNLLKKVSHTQNQFKKASPEWAKAQLLCWKPSKAGMIYPRLDRAVHMKKPHEIAHMVTGEEYSPKMTKGELIALLKTREVQWFAGMDFGYTHNFAVVIGFRDGARMFIVDAFSRAELELGQKLEICEQRLKPYGATIFPDVAYPADIKTFRRHGYRMRDWDKYKGSVVGGIEVVRLKLWPAAGDPELFFLDDDEDVALVFTRLSQYHWKIDPKGDPTDEPDDEDDDEADATRYMVMNVFAPKGKIRIGQTEEQQREHEKILTQIAGPKTSRENEAEQWKQIMNFVGIDAQGPRVPTTMTIEKPGKKGEPPPKLGMDPAGKRGSKGRFCWDMS